MTRILLILASTFLFFITFAQDTHPKQTALKFLEENAEKWGLKSLDIKDMAITDNYVSKHNGITHFYFSQRFDGIPIHNAQTGIHINKDGEVLFSTNRLIPDIYSKVETYVSKIEPSVAVSMAAKELGITHFIPKVISSKRESNEYVFEKGEISLTDIPAKLVYFHTDDGKLRLAWDVEIDQVEANDYATMRIDAVTGQLLDRQSYTVTCSFEQGMYHRHTDDCMEPLQIMGINERQMKKDWMNKKAIFQSSKVADELQATYYIFPLPVESPVHGPRIMVFDKFNEEASPYGWHDVDGVSGPEYTITRGNNVHAWPANGPSPSEPGGEPDGGEELIFDFPYDPEWEPNDFVESATVNLFYSNNMIHDITYAYGFDEESGNFQENNYGKGGTAGDPVRARAQDSGGTNNATFSTPSDGGHGVMRMFVWTRGSNSELRGESPTSIMRDFTTGRADFGPNITSDPLTGPLAYAIDNSSSGSLVCNDVINSEEVSGKIAIVDRGECFFIQKVYNVQQAGAIACIVCNYENSAVGMGAGEGVPNPEIPSVMLSSSDCDQLRQLMNQGVEVIMTFVSEDLEGPSALDGTLDNGIVAHEYGHGISNRLTGGPQLAGCLSNEEQMGEGWSDYFTLVTTVKPGDSRLTPRGIGTFVTSQPIDGRGIRRYPYSTDLNINPLTYDDIITGSIPHALGEVWVAVLWDLYWDLVDEYGFDEDILKGTGGNNMAIQLVMDGMKLQACSPGFLDGRDGILAADRALYDGANQCLIWKSFARRGMGIHAEQGSSDNKNDNIENFDIPLSCLGRLDIQKRTTAVIKPGDNIDVELIIGNYTGELVSGVNVRDELPPDVTFIPGSSLLPVEQIGNYLHFDISELDDNEELVINYQLATLENKFSERVFFDDMEDPESEFNWEFISAGGNFPWVYTDEMPYEGDFSWIIYTASGLDQSLYNFEPITIPNTNPKLRFFHNYDTSPGFNGGYISVSNDGGNTWKTITNEVMRGDYRGKLAFTTFALANLNAFWGSSTGWKESIIDLSEYAGQDVHIRFRYGSQEGSGRTISWSIDNIEVVEALIYNGEACVSANGQNDYCTMAEEGGTYVEAGMSTSIAELSNSDLEVRVFPNPAGSKVNIQLRNISGTTYMINVIGIDGRVLKQIEEQSFSGSATMEVDVTDLAPGMYLFRIQTEHENYVQKVSVQR